MHCPDTRMFIIISQTETFIIIMSTSKTDNALVRRRDSSDTAQSAEYEIREVTETVEEKQAGIST